LTLADLAAMLGLNTVSVSQLLEEARQTSGKTLLTKGYFFDQGMRPTHKEAVVDLYEQGLDELTIAQRTHHAQSSVGHYLRDYERVKLLRKRQIPPEEMIRLLDMQPNVVKAYLSFVEKYHPEID
jgi:protoheme ferro-lyase